MVPLCLFRGFRYADYESDISFLIRPSGGPVWFTGVPHFGYMRYYKT
jgi:hypothetical protein